MADAAFFRKNWTFVALDENDVDRDKQNGSAYPVSNSLLIGNDLTQANCWTIAWLDADGDLHALRKLKLNEGKLIGAKVDDPGSGNLWDVTIEQNGDKIKGKMSIPDSESNLAGSWGAEAPPPFTGDGELVPGRP